MAEPKPIPDPNHDRVAREIDPAQAPTAAEIWQAHAAMLDGRSAITGAAIPADLAACPVRVQLAHYGIACYVARRLGLGVPAPPLGIDESAAEIARDKAAHLARMHAGATCTCDTIAAEDCRGGLRGCDHPRPAPGYEPRLRDDAPGGAE